MAYNKENLARIGHSPVVEDVLVGVFVYSEVAATVAATTAASGHFNESGAVSIGGDGTLTIGSIIYVKGSNGVGARQVTDDGSSSGDVVIAALTA